MLYNICSANDLFEDQVSGAILSTKEFFRMCLANASDENGHADFAFGTSGFNSWGDLIW